ncbi:LytTR family DNA-binding domain-containing protein [Bacteroides sp. UBA939]|uniref:LytTR family DNA-binding domain-containing protein n=1 Tax=Bacteroides sp. UBA939 TaxID=1946092 RepID=UPI0025BBF84D|nr:LytTR family DNA-binding domain-containing protein [Bacteroides sp. UBA939]
MNKYIYFNSRDEFYRIHLSQIVYFMADKNYTVLQLTNSQKLIFTFSLQKMQEYLMEKLQEDARIFARIGKSYIINLNYVYQIDTAKQKLKLFSEATQKEFSLSVSKEALKKLKMLFIPG